jgi:hypothetical protein
MNATIPNSAWPADLIPTTSVGTPRKILKEQADILGQLTGNAVYGEVDSVFQRSVAEPYVHALNLCAPAFRYVEPLLVCRHGEKLYPATISVQEPFGDPNRPRTAVDRESLLSILSQLFAEVTVRSRIQSLLQQTLDNDDE